ncbi:MAG: hypothetical protein MRY64_16025, partial [Hyphomonadaceae bacterium]|nr:hypothetical protein [Hyphomonadaceae bacterium]
MYSFVLGLVFLSAACAPAAQDGPGVETPRQMPAPVPFKNDADVLAAIALYETWSGTCETYEDALSEPVQEGVRLFQE